MNDSIFSESKNAKNSNNSSLSRVVQSYITYYASGKGHTARAKRLDLGHFLSFLTQYRSYSTESKLKVKDWDFSATQRFVDELLGKGEAPSTVARRLATIKHMGRTLAEKIAGFTNPAKEVKAPSVKTLRPKAIAIGELQDIRKFADSRIKNRNSFIRLRNQTIFDFLVDTGLRADEVRLLKFSQLDSNLEWVKNVRTKGRRFRNVYITSEMRAELKQYIEAREKELKRFFKTLTQSKSHSLPLFISTYAATPDKLESFSMGPKTLWRAINELTVGTKLHPHLLRHSYALDLLESSNDVRLVAQALGHSDVRITMRYTERAEQEVAKALEQSRKKKKSVRSERKSD